MRSTVGLLVVALLTACSGSGAQPDAAVPNEDAGIASEASGPTRGGDDAAAVASGCEHATALCVKLAACAPFYLEAVYGDTARCADRLTKACTAQALSAGSGFTQANLLACEAALQGASCGDLLANKLPCTFNGTLTDGAVCGDNTQCASGFCQRAGALCGACAPKSGAGGGCASGTNDECQSGLVCNQAKTCVAPATAGQACDDTSLPCLTGLFCTAAKTCALTVAAGQECPGTYLNIADGTLCLGKSTAANPQLSTQLGAAEAGRPCGLSPGADAPPTLCAPGGVAACSLSSGAITLLGLPTKGVCVAPIQDGFSCGPTDFCEPGAQCINGLCQIPSGRQCL
jgi:hypothetical protein